MSIKTKLKEAVLIHVTGQDYPGILANILGQLKESSVSLQDIQQTTSLGQLSLSLLIHVPIEKGLNVIKDLSYLARAHHLNVDFFVLNEENAEGANTKKNYALTLLAPEIRVEAFHALSQVIADNSINIERMTRLARGNLQCLELILGIPQGNLAEFPKLKKNLFRVAFNHEFDLAIQPENLYRRSKRLIVMDMDSTLIRQEVIDEIADFAGVKQQVAAITERAMNGELDFQAALRERVALLKGLSGSSLDQVIKRISLTPGVEELVFILKKLGFKIAVISGGFSFFTEHFKKQLGLDYQFANTLEIIDGKLTGNVKGQIVDKARKASILRELAKENSIPLDQTVAVGDGANDLDMLETAGLGIAFNAKPHVKDQAGAFISQPGLDSVLYLLGVSQKEVNDLKKE